MDIINEEKVINAYTMLTMEDVRTTVIPALETVRQVIARNQELTQQLENTILDASKQQAEEETRMKQRIIDAQPKPLLGCFLWIFLLGGLLSVFMFGYTVYNSIFPPLEERVLTVLMVASIPLSILLSFLVTKLEYKPRAKRVHRHNMKVEMEFDQFCQDLRDQCSAKVAELRATIDKNNESIHWYPPELCKEGIPNKLIQILLTGNVRTLAEAYDLLKYF